jgi:hypothetical protein
MATNEGRVRGNSGLLIWVVVLFIGGVLYALTAQPGVGLAVVCVGFGWEDFRAAVWLRRWDPWVERGRACLLIYLASGLGKIAAAAFAMIFGCFVTVLIAACVFAPERQPSGRMVVVGDAAGQLTILYLAGIGATAPLFLCGVIAARNHHARIWLGQVAHRGRRLDSWPPGPSERSEVNRLDSFWLSMVVLFGLPSAGTLTGVTLVILGPWLPGGMPSFILFLLVWGIVGALILGSRSSLVQPVAAVSPEACWTETKPVQLD